MNRKPAVFLTSADVRESGWRFLVVGFQFFFPPARGKKLDIWGYGMIFGLFFLAMGGWRLITSDILAEEEERIYAAQSYQVPYDSWVRLRNSHGVRTEDVALRQFEFCLIQKGGRLRHVASHSTWSSSINDMLMLEYTLPPPKKAIGVQCPSRTVYYLSEKKVSELPLEAGGG